MYLTQRKYNVINVRKDKIQIYSYSRKVKLFLEEIIIFALSLSLSLSLFLSFSLSPSLLKTDYKTRRIQLCTQPLSFRFSGKLSQ